MLLIKKCLYWRENFLGNFCGKKLIWLSFEFPAKNNEKQHLVQIIEIWASVSIFLFNKIMKFLRKKTFFFSWLWVAFTDFSVIIVGIEFLARGDLYTFEMKSENFNYFSIRWFNGSCYTSRHFVLSHNLPWYFSDKKILKAARFRMQHRTKNEK